jgi:hypothetical protein
LKEEYPEGGRWLVSKSATPFFGAIEKAFLTAKHAKLLQSSQSQNIVIQFFEIFACTFATSAVNGFRFFTTFEL